MVCTTITPAPTPSDVRTLFETARKVHMPRK
jgi:hypothetical protein